MKKTNSIVINVLEKLKEEPPRLRKSLTRPLYVTLLRICLAEAKPLFPHQIEQRVKRTAPSSAGKYVYEMIKELAPEAVEDTHIFAWDMVPGRHSKKLIKYLYEDLELSWLKKLYLDESINEYITKSLDKQMISVSYCGHTINMQNSDLNNQVSLSIPDSNIDRSFVTRIVKSMIHAYQRVIFVGPRISYLDAVSIRNRHRRDMNSEKNSNRGTRRMQLVYVPNFRGFVLYLIGEKNVDTANHILGKLSRRMEYRALLNGRLSFDKMMRHGTKNNATSYSAVLLKNTAMDFANRLDDTLLDIKTLRYQFIEGYLARLTPYIKGIRQAKTLNPSLQNHLLKYEGNLVRYSGESKERLVSGARD